LSKVRHGSLGLTENQNCTENKTEL
jgi:hypothetical protein